MARGLVTRIESFSAAHRLHSKHLSDEENEGLYGKCNQIHGHGHNYRVEVTVEGEISERTGMVIDLSRLKKIIWEAALDKLDHTNLDKQHDFFAENPSTTENVARYIWRLLVGPIESEGARLQSIKVHETDKNSAEYRG